MRILLVYFSRTGNTARVAEELAWHCGADKEPIFERRDRDGAMGKLRSLCQAVLRLRPPILPTHREPRAYDLVTIGTPVWANAPAAPVRSYVAPHAAEFKRVAFFCTKGRRKGASQVFSELQRLCGQAPVASIAFDAQHRGVPAADEDVRHFMSCLEPQV